MLEFIERLEAMGRQGALIALGIAGTGGVSALALVGLLMVRGDEFGRWAGGAIVFGILMSVALCMVFGMVGVRQLTARHYPPASEVFPSLDPDSFLRALQSEPRPLCVCAACRIHLPAMYSTGACPRCASAVDYYEIASDEDAEMVRVSLV